MAVNVRVDLDLLGFEIVLANVPSPADRDTVEDSLETGHFRDVTLVTVNTNKN